MSTRQAKMAWEQQYSDDSGIEFAVRFDGDCLAITDGSKGVIEFESIDTVRFPVGRIDWLIECLQKIKTEQGL